MIVQFSIIDILLIVGIIQGLVLIFILFSNKKGNHKANRYLAIFILCFLFLTIGDILTTSHLLIYHPHFLLVFDPLIFALAPFGYFYVKSMTNHNWHFNLISFMHFIPAILLYLIFSTVYFENFEIKQDLIIDSYINYDNSTNYFLMTAVIQSLIYLLLNLKMIKEHKERIKNYFSYQESINLNWIKNFLIINAVLWIAFTIATFLNIKIFTEISNLLFSVTVYSIGFFAIKQPDIFFQDVPLIKNNAKDTKDKKKYVSSTLNEEQTEVIAEKLNNLMEKEKLYLKTDLKLVDLAEIISVTPHQLSQVINEKFKKNFNDFVNEFRVEEFKKRLSDNKYSNLTILAIGLDCGFNSKASLNSVFKNFTGFSPSEYKKSLSITTH